MLRELGGDAETMLRLNRSVSTGLNQAAIEIDASLLLLGWPGPDDLRARMMGATYSEIIAATPVPVAIAALHPRELRGRRGGPDEPAGQQDVEHLTSLVSARAVEVALSFTSEVRTMMTPPKTPTSPIMPAEKSMWSPWPRSHGLLHAGDLTVPSRRGRCHAAPSSAMGSPDRGASNTPWTTR